MLIVGHFLKNMFPNIDLHEVLGSIFSIWLMGNTNMNCVSHVAAWESTGVLCYMLL